MTDSGPSALAVVQATEVIIAGESFDSLEKDELSARNTLEAAGIDTSSVGYTTDAAGRAREMAGYELYEAARRFGQPTPAVFADDIEKAAFTFVRAVLLGPLTDALGGAAEPDDQLAAMSEIIAEFMRRT